MLFYECSNEKVRPVSQPNGHPKTQIIAKYDYIPSISIKMGRGSALPLSLVLPYVIWQKS
jgi:hypothetical protein